MTDNFDIIQIIPADGWFAVLSPDGDVEPILVPLTCWALHRGGHIGSMLTSCDGETEEHLGEVCHKLDRQFKMVDGRPTFKPEGAGV